MRRTWRLRPSRIVRREPGGRHVFAEPDRHRAAGQRRRLGQQLDLGGQGSTVVQVDTTPQRLECLGTGNALDLDQISLGMRKPRVGEAMRQTAVVGQDEQALAVAVEPADWINPGDRHECLECIAPVHVAELAQDVVRLE